MYSFDLISRVLNIYNNRSTHNLSISDIISIFNISKSTLYNWVNGKYFISNNKRYFNKQSYQCPDNYIRYITKFVLSNPQFIMKQLLCNIKNIFDVTVSKQSIYNILKKHNITTKKIHINKYPHNRKKFIKAVADLKKSISCRKHRIISVDETSIQLNTIRKYGWCLKGTRCIINKPDKCRRKTFSLLIAISKNKIVGYALKSGSFKAVNFNDFMTKIYKPDSRFHYLLDNASIHHSKLLSDDIKKKFIYNVPYSPQFNPIEYMFNELKRQIRISNIINEASLMAFLDTFIKTSNKAKFHGYFNKSYNNLGIY